MPLNGLIGWRAVSGGVELLSIELLEEHAQPARRAALDRAARRRQRARAPPPAQGPHAGAAGGLHRARRGRARARRCRRRPNGCSTTSTSSRPRRATSSTTCPPPFFRRLPRDRLRRVRRAAAHLRAGARADRLERRPARRAAPAALHQRLPVRHAADDGRAVGVAERAEAGAPRPPARARRRAGARRARIGWRPIAWSRRSKRPRRDQRVAGRGPPRVRHAPAAALARARRDGVAAARAARRRAGGARRDASRTRSAPTGSTRPPSRRRVANLITSLRLIGTFDWSEFFESVSLVEQVLQRDPAGVYSRMDFRSRDRYRHAVEELAAPTGEAQLLLALKSVERARQVHVRAPDSRAAHVGYHLIGGGRPQFERSVGLAARLSGSASAAVLRAGRRPVTSARSPPAPALLIAVGGRLCDATRLERRRSVALGAARRACRPANS